MFIIVSSCSSDDNNDNNNNQGGGSSAIIGKWENFERGTILYGTEEEVMEDYEHEEGCFRDYIEFFSNGKMKTVFYLLSENGNGCQEITDPSNYSVSGNTVTFSKGGQSATHTFSISSNLLEIRFVDEDTNDIYIDVYKKI